MSSSRHCQTCFKTNPHSGFASNRSAYCRECLMKELERQNKDYFTEKKTGRGFSNKVNDHRRKPSCVVCKKRGHGHEDDCLWNPSKHRKGLGLNFTTTYVPKARYEYLCINGHTELTNLPPEKAFCPSCRTPELRLMRTIEPAKKDDDLPVGKSI